MCIKKHIIFELITLVAAVIFAAEPMVTDVTAKQRYPWNGLVDITCRVSGISGTTNGLYLTVAAVNSGITNNVFPLWLVQNGKKTINREVHTNGNYRLLWDARAGLGAVICSNMVLRVNIKEHKKVQLWAGGPYWATTNIGAEEPWEYGYYFWWGDTVGCRRENNAWFVTDGSSSNFSFEIGSTPTYGKSNATMQSQGWIVAQNGTYVLAPEHDAAQVQWSGGWRMPTFQELTDLNNNCDWAKTTLNSVNGYVVRGKGDFSVNSIFLPCAGLGSGNALDLSGLDGYCWSSVPYTFSSSYGFSSDYGYAYQLHFNSSSHSTDHLMRNAGRSVRPVQGFSE